MDSNITSKLLYIQSRLKAPKSQYNSFGKYNYRNAEDIIEAVKPFCNEVKAALVLSDEIVMVGDRVYLKATARLADCESDQDIAVTAYAREAAEKKGMDDSQITGTASSYARKSALGGLFALDDAKDADTDEYRKENDIPGEVKQTSRPAKPTKQGKTAIDPESKAALAAEAEQVVKRFEELASKGLIAQDSLDNMHAAYVNLKGADDYKAFMANCRKNIQQAEKALAEVSKAGSDGKDTFKDDDIPF